MKMSFEFLVAIFLSISNAGSKPVIPGSRARRSLLQSRAISFSGVTSIGITTKLYSRTNMFIQIDMNGAVSGTSNCSRQTVTMQLSSVGSGVKMIRGVSSGRYLAMNRSGVVYSTVSVNLAILLYLVSVFTEIESLSLVPGKRLSLSVNPSAALLHRITSAKLPTVKLYSRTTMTLQIDKNGKVSGTEDCSRKSVSMELLSVGRGVKMIRGVSSGRYLAMNRSGVVYSTQTSGEEAMFLERMESNGYSTFASFKFYRRVFYDTLVAVSSNGTLSPGTKTNRLHKSAQFLVLPSFICPFVS